ncbi:MAG: MCP four helix bundle domain-containing protein, partial [Gammaproteobacteria bacterium]
MFRNMRIGMRLTVGFSLVIALLCGVAAIGTTRLSELNTEVGTMVNARYPSTVAANDVIDNVNLIANAMRDMLLTERRDEIAAEVERIQRARQTIKDRIERLDTLVTSERGRELLGKVLDARVAYIDGQDQIINLATGGRTGEARQLLRGEIGVRMRTYFTAVNDLLAFMGEEMDAAGKATAATYAAARQLLFTLALAAAMIGFGVAFWITRSVTRPLAEAVRAAQRLAEGDLAAQISVSSRDETGQLLAAMKNMIEKLAQIISEVRGAASTL